MSTHYTDEPVERVAVIGVACRLPQARTADEFWGNVRDGREAITFFSAEELSSAGVAPALLRDPRYVRAAGFLEDSDAFDAEFFGYTAREAEIIDPQHRLFLECAWHALEAAGHDPQRYRGSVGVYAGASRNTYQLNLASRPELAEAAGWLQLELANEKDHLATRASYKLNLRGPSVNIQTACSTSLVAVHMACQSLLTYQCDMALAGGSSVKVPPREGYLYQEGGIASPDGHCRPFDAEAKGTVRGSGVGVVVLKRLSDALADGDSIQALILGSAINNDGALKAGYTAPSQRGQAEVIIAAQTAADADARTITYVEAHGTGTPLGDPIELAALTQAFRASGQGRGFCAVGSVKGNIGHLDAAAGVAGLIKVVQALRHRTIPPTLHFRQPNPAIDFAQSPFYVNRAAIPWHSADGPLRAGVSSFGMGGTNAHAIVEEYRQPESAASRRPYHLLPLSARTARALGRAAEYLSRHLREHPDANLADVAYTLQVGRRAFRHRRAVVCRDAGEAASALEGGDATGFEGRDAAGKNFPLVFMFPGQGAQHVNMARKLYEYEPRFRKQVDACAEYLLPQMGFDLRRVLYPSAEESARASRELERTLVAQPALFVIEYALARLLMERGVEPAALIGHSVGELVAACVAGVFTPEAALTLITARGRLCQQLPGGAMLSVALPREEVEPLLDDSLSLAAVNAPSLCVVSGPSDAARELHARLARRGVPCSLLHTSHAFHSRMMEPALEHLAEAVRRSEPRPPCIKLLSGMTGDWLQDSEATDPRYWARQLREPVRFADGIGRLLKSQWEGFLEVGPGQTLTTFVRQQAGTDSGATVLHVCPNQRAGGSDYAQWLRALGRLWTLGVPLDKTHCYAGESRRRVALPTYPFERTRYWVEAARGPRHDPPPGQLTKRGDVADWLYTPSWRSSVAPRRVEAGRLGESRRRWLILLGGDGLGERLAERLREEGHEVVVASAGDAFDRMGAGFVLNPLRPRDYEALFERLRAEGGMPQSIVHLLSLGARADEGRGVPPRSGLELGFYSLLFLAQALGREQPAERLHLTVVSEGLQTVDGREAVCPETAAMLGLLTVLPQEYPSLNWGSVDVCPDGGGQPRAGELAERLLCELLAGPFPEPVALRGRQRWVRGFEPLRWPGPAAPAARLRRRGVYLITGGLGRIGSAFAEHLARSAQARLVLVGRNRANDEADRLREFERLGAEVLVLSADAADEGQMRRAFEGALTRFGEVNGVIHSAGVVRGKSLRSIQTLNVEACETQFRAKVDGVRVLERVLRGRELDFCLLNSSLASVLGGLGFGAYAAANAFMDAFARRQAGASAFPWISVNWDAWTFDGEPEAGLSLGADIRRVAMTASEGAGVLQSILQLPHAPQVIVSTADLDARLRTWVRLEGDGREGEESTRLSRHTRPELDEGYAAPANSLERIIADVWQECLGLSRVGANDNFLELGGHSLLAMHIIARLRSTFQVEIPLRKFFEALTVAGLAGVVEELLVEKLKSLPGDASE